MKKIVFILALPFLISFSSCTEGETNGVQIEEGTFIFGSFNGFCQGNCTHLFKYENGQVFRDEMDRFDEDNFTFSSDAEDDIKEIAQRLFSEFPEFLKDSEQKVYGCPGCTDQSTLYIRLGESESVQSWRLDSFEQEDWPQELKDYVRLLVTELDKIIIF